MSAEGLREVIFHFDIDLGGRKSEFMTAVYLAPEG